MEAVRNKLVTHEFGPPENWDAKTEGTCATLPVRVYDSSSGMRIATSYWKPTAMELTRLVQGGVLELSIWGGQPPVALHIIKDPDKE